MCARVCSCMWLLMSSLPCNRVVIVENLVLAKMHHQVKNEKGDCHGNQLDQERYLQEDAVAGES